MHPIQAHLKQVLRKHVTGKQLARERQLSTPDRHALRIARDTMRMHCTGALVMGGPNHYAAAETIERLTGQIVGIPSDCTCQRGEG